MPDRPTDRHVMHAEEVANLFHRVGAGSVGLCQDLIAVRVSRPVMLQRLGDRSTLSLGHFT